MRIHELYHDLSCDILYQLLETKVHFIAYLHKVQYVNTRPQTLNELTLTFGSSS